MGQNLASVHFTAEQWAELDGAIGVVEALWEPMLVVLPSGRRGGARAAPPSRDTHAHTSGTRDGRPTVADTQASRTSGKSARP